MGVNSCIAVLPDLQSFEESCAHAFARKDRVLFAVLAIGLDKFKAMNAIDYALADDLLDLCCERLLSGLRESDRIVRLSAEEFAILVPALSDEATARTLAERLKDLLQRPFAIRGQVVNVTANIGITLSSIEGASPEDMLKRAGIALRFSKAQGAGTIHFFEIAMEKQLIMRHSLAHELRKALPLRQLEVFYQPQVDAKTLILSGFEALLRWKHPRFGWVSPAEFIPLAEEIGLIDMMGEWVLKRACYEAAQLPGPITFAVNVSPVQLRNPGFLKLVVRALEGANIPGNKIELEVTEGILIENSEEMLATLHGLHALGVKLAMDDFGTGYSSLSKLATLPFDTIKIDKSLIGKSAKHRAIVRSVVVLGSGLGMNVLAEGIESEEDLSDVRMDGCTAIQGYLLGRPRPARELPDVIVRLQQSAAQVSLL